MRCEKVNRLKMAPAEKGMANKQLVGILDKDLAVISRWVADVAQPSLEVFVLLTEILGIRVDDLLWTDGL